MLIPRRNKTEIYSYLFQEGVLVCSADVTGKHHPDIPYPVTNLQILKLMKTFETKKFVKDQYAWRTHYWFLTNEGVEYLREYLSLPDTIVPKTMSKQTKIKTFGDREEGGRRGGFRGGRGRGGFSRGGRGGRGGFRGSSRENAYRRDGNEDGPQEESSERRSFGRGKGFAQRE